MSYEVKQLDKFQYIDVGEGEPLVLFHGLFGALSNFEDLIDHFKGTHRVIVPLLPLFGLDLLSTTVGGLQKYVNRFFEKLDINDMHLLGNSLGGACRTGTSTQTP